MQVIQLKMPWKEHGVSFLVSVIDLETKNKKGKEYPSTS